MILESQFTFEGIVHIVPTREPASNPFYLVWNSLHGDLNLGSRVLLRSSQPYYAAFYYEKKISFEKQCMIILEMTDVAFLLWEEEKLWKTMHD
jgi:hypothetical protein